MEKITDHYRRWLLEKLSHYDKLIFLGAVIWLKWGEEFPLPRLDPKSPAWWTTPIFLIIGLVGNQYFRLSKWWSDLLIDWALGFRFGRWW